MNKKGVSLVFHDYITLTGPDEFLGLVEREVMGRDGRVAGIKCDYTGRGPVFRLEIILKPQGEKEARLPVTLSFKQFAEGDIKSAASRILWAVEHGARVEYPGEKTFKITS
ncbi:hypothetical protein DCCM_2008 [Desulfocucumis palustris]|uniref:Uncharacterized protein n=1 Tax=Desulfocucumis palustris TaxID=1898651 RepID=A0A2L2XG91_9FIRM|nr:hypothetical protein [Desulfocucumis palustris]GBF32911.1 hypothetical protein DCCM_2008 [Desulfocucumis palustris]